MQTYHYLLSSNGGLYELHSSVQKAIDKITSLENQKDENNRAKIKQFLTYLDKYEKQFKNKGAFLLAFYLLGYVNESTESIMAEYSKQIGFTGFDYEEIKTLLHNFVFYESCEQQILPSKFQQTLEKCHSTFSEKDYNMAEIVDFVENTYIKSEDKEKLNKLVDLFYDDLSNRMLNLIQNTNVIFTELIAKMQKSLKNGEKDVSLYKHDIMDCDDVELAILPIENYRIEKIPFVG